MASVANAFSLLDEGPGEGSKSKKSKSKSRRKGESASEKPAQPPAAQPEQLCHEDFEAGFQAVAAKGKARGTDPARGTADARSAAEAAESAAGAADSAADMIQLWRSWTQQVWLRATSFS